MELLKELGYQFKAEALQEKFERAGMELSQNTCNWYEAAAPYIVMAYERGREGKPLSALFPFLEVSA